MKLSSISSILLLACTALLSAQAQPQGRPPGGGFGGPPGGAQQGPRLGGAFTKVLGANTAFSATLVMQAKDADGKDVTLPGQIAFLEGKVRFEMDLTQVQGGRLPPGAAERMKAMGMGTLVSIARPDKKVNYMVYPGLESYAEIAMSDADAAGAGAKATIDTTELGKESLDGHACVKARSVVTDDKGTRHEFTTWNAGDLKSFPIKVTHTDEGWNVTLLFTNVKLTAPETAQFDPPAKFTRHENIGVMMQEAIMKRMAAPQK